MRTLSGKNPYFRCAALLLAVFVMLCAMASCGKDGDDASQPDKNAGSDSFFEDESLQESLDDFLDRFVRWYSVPEGAEWSYDCGKAAEGPGNILACVATPASCADWTLYSDIPEEDCFIEKTNDPRKWAAETNAYYAYDAEVIDFIAGEIFNVSADDIKTMIRTGYESKAFYCYKGKYYTLYEGVFDSYVNAEITSVEKNGDRYIIGFDVFSYSESDDEDSNVTLEYKCTAEMGLKEFNEDEFWSLYRFDSSKN